MTASARGSGFLRWVLDHTLVPLVALLLMFEEWGWQPLARLFRKLRTLPVWAAIEDRIARLPPYAALVAFGTPAVMLFPVKLLALYLIGAGKGLAGVSLIVTAKIVGTAIVARMFQLTQPTLMRLGWFARVYTRWKRWKDSVIARVKRSDAWHTLRNLRAAMKWQLRRVRRAWRVSTPR